MHFPSENKPFNPVIYKALINQNTKGWYNKNFNVVAKNKSSWF